MTLDMQNLYRAKFTDARFIEKDGKKGRAGTTRRERHRALNSELEVYDESGELIGVIPWGISVVKITALIRFFNSIKVFFDPEVFDPETDLEGREVMISVNNVCDDHWGLRTVVDKFFPVNMQQIEGT